MFFFSEIQPARVDIGPAALRMALRLDQQVMAAQAALFSLDGRL